MFFRFRHESQGFALPTVVITSVVMFAVLVAVSGIVSSTRTSLDQQFYEGLASDAAESGGTIADACLQANANTSPWGTNSLTPGTSCSGSTVSGQSAYVISPTATGNSYSSTYTVAPVVDTGSGTQNVTVTGTVNLLRRSTGGTWKTYTKTLKLQLGGQISATNVAFGYTNDGGAFFGAISGDGKLRTLGYNGQGQLGNGTFSSTLIPNVFQIPSTSPVVKTYTSFLSVGYNMIAITQDGNAWIAGLNDYGQTGTGSTSTSLPAPAQIVLPNGVNAVTAVVGLGANYILGNDNNIYSMGGCYYGMLGNNYSISGCANQLLPVRVNLPTPNAGVPNTIPTTNIISDRYNTYVRMSGGAVYGWGENQRGQLGSDSFVDQSSPVKIGTYGDAGQPRASQIAFDGETLFVLDSTGRLNSIGSNLYGAMGNTTMSLVMDSSSGKCLDNTNADGVSFKLYACNGTPAQKFQFRSDGSLYNANKNVCLDNTNADGVTLRLLACNGTPAQKYVWDPGAHTIYNAQANKCVDNSGGDGITMQLYACNGTINQRFLGYNANLTPFDMSGISGTIKKIWTDQWAVCVLTTNGEVWSAGTNKSGHFGNGTVSDFSPNPTKFDIPVSASDIYITHSGSWSSYSYQNLFAIGVNGRVYGAGANSYGQLGNGSTAAQVKTPVEMQVINGTDIVAKQVQVGMGTTVIFTTNGSVYTVGNNASGQLGDGTKINRSTPIRSKYVNDLKTVAY